MDDDDIFDALNQSIEYSDFDDEILDPDFKLHDNDDD
jgi:hypothetical protein